jgi:hypothetical protein
MSPNVVEALMRRQKCTLTRLLLLFSLLWGTSPLFGQVYLEADGMTETYTLINRVLGGTAVEGPDCSHPDFGPHMTQAWDPDVATYVFALTLHVTPDNDRCVAFDRQRNEIKTYGPSPAYLKAFYGDVTTYRWTFRLDEGFQPSPNFTHMHQIKAGDGPDADVPIITLTPRVGSPDQLQLIHVDSASHRTTVATTSLSPLKGTWVEAYERITHRFDGTYAIVLRLVSDGTLLLAYSQDHMDLWRNGTTFSRPKWGLYRSLKSPQYLRDEQVRFARFCLAKGTDDCSPS